LENETNYPGGVHPGVLTKLRNLPQYKDKTEAELLEIAQSKRDRAKYKVQQVKDSVVKSDLDVEEMFSAKEEKEFSKELLSKYLRDFSLENISDKTLLKQLIYLEVFHKCRLQKSAEDFQKQNGAVPLQILDSIHRNLDKIIQLKTSLGLTQEAKSEKREGFEAFELLMKKAEIWRSENQASRTIVCGYCGKMNMLKIRTTAWEVQKHPFFRDRILGNQEIIRLYKEGILTKENLAAIFGTSSDYTDWLIDKWNKLDQQLTKPKTEEV
jgi:hypothetical protein